MKQDRYRRLDDIAPLIGNTPLLRIRYRYGGEERRLFAKCEYYNYTGSIKDRVAYHILRNACENGSLLPGDSIAEATSGNTGISFSALGRLLGHQVTIFMPDWMSVERIRLMESYGAQVRLVSREEGGFLGSIRMAEESAAGGGVFLPRQFSNEENTQAHCLTTGPEIARALEAMSLRADGVVAGVGTGGTIMGIGQYLRRLNPGCIVSPLEPRNSPTLSTGYKVGKHRIYGISDEFIPEIVKLDQLDTVISVDDGDAIRMARMLSGTLGLGVGVSSGANFLGAVLLQQSLGRDSTVVTVFADDNKKYLSTDYAGQLEEREDFVSVGVELLDVTACG